jgi:hypothetical protein
LGDARLVGELRFGSGWLLPAENLAASEISRIARLRSVADGISGILGDVKVRSQRPVKLETGDSPTVMHRENRSDRGEKRQLRGGFNGEAMRPGKNSEDFLSSNFRS